MDYDDQGSARPPYQHELSEQVRKKEDRKLEARHHDRSIWYGLGMFGLVGWSIALPTIIGIAIGIWMDRTWDHKFSCTLMCLLAGVAIGCAIAWYWVKRETQDPMDSNDFGSPDESNNNARRSQEK